MVVWICLFTLLIAAVLRAFEGVRQVGDHVPAATVDLPVVALIRRR